MWITTAALFLGMAIAFEAFWRAEGHQPGVVDSPQYWAHMRAQVPGSDRQQIMLLGASRSQLGMSLDTFEDLLPEYTTWQLSIPGRSPVASLLDLAQEEDYQGLVICSVASEWLAKSYWDAQQPYVDFYRQRYGPLAATEAEAKAAIQSRLLMLSPTFRPRKMIQTLLAGDLPKPHHITRLANRSGLADYTKANVAKIRASRLKQLRESIANSSPDPEKWISDFREIEEAIHLIQSRGARVILVRLPTAIDHWELTDAQRPRHLYWDRMAALTEAETIHFQEVPSLQQFEMPDSSHVDYRDAPALTKALIEEIAERGYVTIAAEK